RPLCLSPRGARPFRGAAAFAARTTRETRAVARARSGHAHRCDYRRQRAARRRHARRSRAGARNPRRGGTRLVGYSRHPHPEERPVWAASRRMRMTRLTLRDGPRTRGRRAETRSRALLRVRRSETLTRSGGVRTGTAMTAAKKIVFQGEPGANSHLASRDVYPDYEPVPCATFEDAFAAINTGEAEFGMIPIENSVAGRVADIHHLLPDSGLHIVAEHFMPVRHQLLAPKGATL